MNSFTIASPKQLAPDPTKPLPESGESYDELWIKDIQLQGQKLDHVSFIDTRLEKAEILGSEITESLFRRALVTDCRLSGLIAYSSIFTNTEFKNCKLEMANLRGSKFTNVRFTDCVLTEADFDDAVMTNVAFVNCELSKAEFNGASCSNVDLRTSEFNDLRGIYSLKGATLRQAQLIKLAPMLAVEIGLEVED